MAIKKVKKDADPLLEVARDPSYEASLSRISMMAALRDAEYGLSMAASKGKLGFDSTPPEPSGFEGFTPGMKIRIQTLARHARKGAGVEMLREREREFTSEAHMMLAGIGMVPEARAELEQYMDENAWAAPKLLAAYSGPAEPQEIIIGAGFHAAAYAIARVKRGFPKPLVLERGGPAAVGGTFAMSRVPSFYLNSENRRGGLGLPRDGDALNVLPGATLQVSDFTRQEFPTNADMAFVIRLALAQYANVVVDTTVDYITTSYNPVEVTTSSGRNLRAYRLIDARGIGPQKDASKANGDTILTFTQFMARQDSPHPMRGMQRVAVVGAGNGAMTAVESLVGISPQGAMAAMNLDGVPRIDWYGRGLPATKEEWRDRIRGRYQRLASYLPDSRDLFHDVTVYPLNTGRVTESLDSVIVNERTYDHVIVATGYEPYLDSLGLSENYEPTGGTGRPYLASQYAPKSGIYRIGPAARLAFTTTEFANNVGDEAANAVSMFRLANRTAALAAGLKAPSGAPIAA